MTLKDKHKDGFSPHELANIDYKVKTTGKMDLESCGCLHLTIKIINK